MTNVALLIGPQFAPESIQQGELMAIKVVDTSVDFDRMAQLLERMRASTPQGDRWNAAFDELRGIVTSRLDEDDNVLELEASAA